MSPGTPRPRLAVFKLTSCDGCQVQIFNLDRELLALADRFEIAFFREGSSRESPGPYDVSLVEGSVTTPDEVRLVRRIRDETRFLVAIGACATSGGSESSARPGSARVEEWKQRVYPHPEWIDTLATSTPISDHVAVDCNLEGCPIDREQLRGVLAAALRGTGPALPRASVCLECKRAGHACVMVTRGIPCMGPVTRAGCGAICPSLGRDCYACFGPASGANPDALAARLRELGLSAREIEQREPFRAAADRQTQAEPHRTTTDRQTEGG